MAKVIKEKEMNVSAEALANVILDFENYPEILGEVKKAVTTWSTDKKDAKVNFELEVVKRFNYDLKFAIEYPAKIAWSLMKSDFFKENRGSWTIKKLGDKKCHVTYEVEVSFGFLVPGWVTKKLTEVNLPKMLEKFESAAKARA